jgi:hypothetical protein
VALLFKDFRAKNSKLSKQLLTEQIMDELTHAQKIEIQNKRFESIDWPVSIHAHQLANCEMFPSRENVIPRLPRDIDYLEVGVLAGDYTQRIVDACNPKSVFLVDTFSSNDWFHSVSPRFTYETHESFVRSRFESVNNLELRKGFSQDVMPKIDNKFDYIYLDADHGYDAVWQDLNNAASLLKPGGIIGMNDYIVWDFISDEPYGVVQATNRFLNENPDWYVKYYALSTTLFSDIYFSKAS